MIRRHAPLWGALLAFSSGLFALHCSLEGLGDGARPPSSPDDGGAGDGSVSRPDAGGDATNGPWPENVIIVGLPAPDRLAVGPDFLYFTTAREGGSVERCPIAGCSGQPESIAIGQKEPRGLTVTQNGLVGWANFRSGEVMLASRGTGASLWKWEPLATGQASPAGVAIRAKDYAVWTNSAAAKTSAVVARRNGQQTTIAALSRIAVQPGPILLPEGSDVVWGESGGLSETLLEGDGSDGNAPCTFVHSHASVTNLVVGPDPLQVYWTTADGLVLTAHRPPAADALQRCEEAEVTSLAKEQGDIASLAVDPLYVYFSVNDGGKGSLRRAASNGSEVEVLLDGLNDPRGVVLDGTYVYVAVRGDGTIRRVVRLGI